MPINGDTKLVLLSTSTNMADSSGIGICATHKRQYRIAHKNNFSVFVEQDKHVQFGVKHDA